MGDKAKTFWRWSDIAGILGITIDEKDLWKQWVNHIMSYSIPATPAVAATTSQPSKEPVLTEFRGCPLVFLRSLLRFMDVNLRRGEQSCKLLQEIMIERIDSTKKYSIVLCQQMLPTSETWFHDTLRVVADIEFEGRLGACGYLHSLLPCPVEVQPSSRLYSCVVHGLGRNRWCEPAMERVEWLAVEILSLMRDLLRTRHSEYASSLLSLIHI